MCQGFMDRNHRITTIRKEKGLIFEASLPPLSPSQAILWGSHIQTRYYSGGSADAQKSIYNLISFVQPNLSQRGPRQRPCTPRHTKTRQDIPKGMIQTSSFLEFRTMSKMARHFLAYQHLLDSPLDAFNKELLGYCSLLTSSHTHSPIILLLLLPSFLP